MNEDPYVFLNRIANNCKAIEDEEESNDFELEDYHHNESDWPAPEYPERKDWLIPELI